ncbi:UNKNOWN [Stylonychia lemnae]|uniref:Uncharacterized protein n=1 Tax=Stylonychia lemnae TaxID=5949 RepID=A0A078B5M9_STYLE|nr:UNKNOWN [Stylonychia lemnae]|eukprot:CDW89511.1 UNKNOWN [Stylonychia lemnae]
MHPTHKQQKSQKISANGLSTIMNECDDFFNQMTSEFQHVDNIFKPSIGIQNSGKKNDSFQNNYDFLAADDGANDSEDDYSQDLSHEKSNLNISANKQSYQKISKTAASPINKSKGSPNFNQLDMEDPTDETNYRSSPPQNKDERDILQDYLGDNKQRQKSAKKVNMMDEYMKMFNKQQPNQLLNNNKAGNFTQPITPSQKQNQQQNYFLFNENANSQIQDLKAGSQNNETADDELDSAIIKITDHLASFGFPDPGNLRSNKKKDVRKRIKCLVQLLKQRQRDLDYRQQYEGKMIRLQQDRDMYEQKYKQASTKVQELDKEKYALQLQIKDKTNEVKNTIDRQKTLSKGHTEVNVKLEQRVNLLSIEIKKLETKNTKLQDQIKRLMGIDKCQYSNSIEATSKAINGQNIFRNLPEKEYSEQIQKGNSIVQDRLLQENHHLKDCLLLIHQSLKGIMDQHFVPLFKLSPAQIPVSLLDELGFLKNNQFKLEQVITPLMLNIPQNTQSLSNMIKLFNENLKKIEHFYIDILNPLNICQIILDINNLLAEKSALSKDGQSIVYTPITTYEELKQIIKSSTIQINLLGSNNNQNATNKANQDGDNGAERGRQSNVNKPHATSKSRKKWSEQNDGNKSPENPISKVQFQKPKQQQEQVNLARRMFQNTSSFHGNPNYDE